MDTKEVGPKLEYNLAGSGLLTIRPKDFSRLQEEVVKAGFRHACILPFHAFDKDEQAMANLINSPLQVVHLEEAWNPLDKEGWTRLAWAALGHLRRFLGDKTEPPILQDAFLFPSKATCGRFFQEMFEAFPEAKFISHGFRSDFSPKRLLLEINPGIELSAQEIIKETEKQGISLVFDPSHLLKTDRTTSLPNAPTTTPKDEWERQFTTFAASGRLEVVDINPGKDGESVRDLRLGRGRLKELALAAREVKSVKFLRVEIPTPAAQQIPGSPLQARGFEFLREIGQALGS